MFVMGKRKRAGFSLRESLARFSWTTIFIIFLILMNSSIIWAMEKPSNGQLQSYAKDGSLNLRIQNALALGNHIVAPELVQSFRRQIERIRLGQAGMTDAEIDQIIGSPSISTRVLGSKGTIRVFALLISFPDYPASQTSEAIASRLFGNGDGGWPYESLRNYYLRSSYSALDIKGDVLGWYTPSYTRASMPQTPEARENLIKEALLYYQSQGHDFSQYDNDQDGTVDYFMVIWTGPDNGWGGFWWGYQTSISDQSFSLDGKGLSQTRYSWLRASGPDATGFETAAAIHETGNALGLPDYYDYVDQTSSQVGSGGLDMMDNDRGDHNPFSKMLLGWISPRVFAVGKGEFTLRASGTSPDALLIVPGSSAKTLDEFYLIQNRFRTENDFYLPGDGLLIWHMDVRVTSDGHFLSNNSSTGHDLLNLVGGGDQARVQSGIPANSADYFVEGKSVTLSFDPALSSTDSGASIYGIGPSGQTQYFTVETQSPSLSQQSSAIQASGSTIIISGISVKDQVLASAATYYVDAAGGNDSNNGLSTSTAWKTVSKVNSSKFLPGETVLFKCGGNWREQLTVPSSGSAGNPITFGAYGTGAKPIINGSDVLTSWSLVTGTTYAKSALMTEPKVVVYNGTRVTKGTGTTLASNQYYYNAGAATLYINVGENPAAHTLEAAARTYSIWISHHDYVNFSNLDTRNTNDAGFYIQDSDYLDLNACDITQVAYRGTLVTNVIGSSETSKYLNFRNMQVSHSGGTGISVDGDADVTGHVLIQNCIVHDCGWNADAIDAVRWTAGIKVWGGANYGVAGESDDVVIENCEVYNQVDTHGDYSGGGIWVDQWGTGAVVRKNKIHNNATYGVLLENMNDGALVNNNLVYLNKWGIAVYRDIKNQKIYNNTLFNNSDIGLWCKGGENTGTDHMTGNEFKNNIVIGSVRALSAIRGGENSGNGSGNVYEYNCFGLEKPNFIEWGLVSYWGASIYKSTYATWESAYGRTTHSVGADPLFVSASNPLDFRLQPNSPCISKGIPVNLSTDIVGNPVPAQQGKNPDIGAFESTSQVTVSVPTVTTANITGPTSSSVTYGGTVTSDGGATVTARGVCWGSTANPAISGSHTLDGSGTGSYTGSLTGLTPGTTYHVRAFATNSSGTGYGSDVTFTTSQVITPPAVATSAVTSVTSTSAAAGGNVTSAGGGTITERGVCWALTANPTISGSHVQNGSGTGIYTCSLTGLTAGTTYHVRAYATNSSGTGYGSDLTFTTTQGITPPTVATSAATSITSTSAAAGGNVTSDGGATVTARGVCWALTANPTISGSHVQNGSGTGIYTCSLTGLTAGTTYHVRAYATNSSGTGYGSDVTFTTTQVMTPPSVATSAVTSITSTSAVGGGNVTSDGGATVTARGVCWALTANPTISGSHVQNGSGTGSYTCSLTGLTPGTTYHVRAYATNSSGTGYGSDVTFTTTQVMTPPSVATSAVTSITSTSAVGGGNVTSDGGATVTARGVCWALTANPTISGSHMQNGSGTGSLYMQPYRVAPRNDVSCPGVRDEFVGNRLRKRFNIHD